ncbi:MAG: CBS domain-containing protein [Sutterellaceae bacterium]|nr:CBS domain-containing protein [Sutterellaceae bacterium]MDD7442415.1 CBS domain-containing protein [Sutterellaceae bacterium]MDY2868876.1 CBS domain-containing protein [Mesosutterella sp.]
MKVIDLAVRHVECISAPTSIRDCALAMRRRHVGSLVVTDSDNKPIGVITDRDITIEVTAMGRDPLATSVADVMTSPVVTAKSDDDLVDALAKMREFGIRRLPVVDESGLLVGVITNSNMLEELAVMLDSLVRDIKSSKTREIELRP